VSTLCVSVAFHISKTISVCGRILGTSIVARELACDWRGWLPKMFGGIFFPPGKSLGPHFSNLFIQKIKHMLNIA